MKPGQIWSGLHKGTGVKSGWVVCTVNPAQSMGRPGKITHVVTMQAVKNHKLYIYAMLGPEGLPLLKDGSVSDAWELIEDVP